VGVFGAGMMSARGRKRDRIPEELSAVMHTNADREIARNVAVHDRIARKYETRHGEIFNEIEQNRLRSALTTARNAIRTGAEPPRAFDFGCGSGNLTGHLLALGFDVTAADVSPGFLDLVHSRHPQVVTVLMNGRDLSNIPDSSFDLVATYSVLHHVPDYIGAVREMARICRPGGVVCFDHEQNERYWEGDPLYGRFRREAMRFDWRKYLRPMNYLYKIRRTFDPKFANEGDIHVWPDDHIDWGKIKQAMANDFEIVLEQDYLLYQQLYRREIYDQ
jgi:ubiquinone/menaquinone biosynthesis C-methylase UbiE